MTIESYNIQIKNPVEVIYILGAGHCGSTLLSLCLDQHSSIIGLSEIITLNRKKPGWSGDRYALNDHFWSEVDRVMNERYRESLREVPFNLRPSLPSYYLALQRNRTAFNCILNVAGKTIICDSSKDSKRLNMLLESKLFKVRVIYLVRDGRAIVHSYRRKYGSWLPGWFNLTSTDRAARRLKTRFGSNNWLTIRYEDMVTDLEGTLRKISNFAEINFEPTMLKPDTSNFKGLGGNNLLKRPIDSIKLDTAWKTEMPTIVRAFTSVTVSSYNRRHGYKN